MVSLRRAMVVLLVFVGAASCAAPETQSKQTKDGAPKRGTVLWRGFEHAWTYNHRLNRLGDYVDVECASAPKAEMPRRRCQGEAVHTGASGTGADTATYRSFHSRIVSDQVGFQTGSVELRIDGREERELRVEHDGQVPAEGKLRDRDEYVVLLNGFDVYAKGKRAKAKKVQQFRVWSRGEGEYNDSEEAVEFEVGALVNMNCDSVECKQQGNRVRYTIELRYVIAAYDEAARKTSKSFETAYAWNKKEELERADLKVNRKQNRIKGVRQEYDSASMGFRELNFDLGKKGKTKDHWFVEWAHTIRDIEYDPESGVAGFDLHLFFKEWNRRSKKKMTSLATKGEATLRADVVLLQFEDAKVEHHDVSGEIEWKGKNRAASSDEAVSRHPFEMTF